MFVALPEEPVLSLAFWEDCANALRRLHADEASAGGAGSAGDEQLRRTEHLIAACQQTAHDLDVNTVKTLYLQKGFNMAGSRTRGRRFKAAFLLKILMVCTNLKTTNALNTVMKHMASICLPKSLRHMIDELLTIAESHMPHASTISRYRTVLDGAFMLFERRSNAILAAAEGSTRF